ncbi:MAG: LysE family translocator [Nitratireductor sp.]|nr:LysE family translocator [Nitratireductor sp.]
MTLLGLDLGVLAGFALASALVEMTPGPNMTYLAIVAAGEGRKRGFMSVAGVALGLALIGIAAALGITAVLQNSVLAWEIMRWAGVLYLLWLAWEGWRGDNETVVGNHGQNRGWLHFRRGLVTNLLNPKAAIFYVAVLPAFLPQNPTLAQTLTLTMLFVLIATTIHAAIVALAGFAQPFLTDPNRERIARRTLSLLLAFVALWFAWKTAR